VDLGLLLIDPAVKMLDSTRAATLFEQAYSSGILIGGFELAALYEHGILSEDGSAVQLQPDAAKAWFWYRAAAKRHEPHSLARIAERAEQDAIANASSSSNALLLEAFVLYARATENARQEGWPDTIWRTWRYRRASLARVLAAEHKMPEVARAYASVLDGGRSEP